MIIFHNPGLIPIDAIRLMGASVKVEGAFGRFGTGFKYAVATVLRGGGSVRIWRGRDVLSFGYRPVEMRGETFNEVVMTEEVEDDNAPPRTLALGFTTQLGKDWEPWMALRELACNARDEGGNWALLTEAGERSTGPAEDQTVIVVEWEAMEQAAREDGEHVFAPSGEVLLEELGVRVLPGPSDYLYHRGVRVWKLPKPSVFTYDITGPVELTEDRTVKYGFCVVANVRNMILQTEDRTVIAAAVMAKKDTWERGFDWSGAEWASVPPGATWLDEVAAMREARASSYNSEVSPSATDVLLKHRAFKEVHHSSSWSTYEGKADSLNYASDILEDLGMSLDEGTDGVPVYITRMLPGDALSAINGGRVFIAERLLDERTSVIVRELLRRQLELKSGGDHDALLDFAAERLFDVAMKHDHSLRRDWGLAQEEAEKEAEKAAEPAVPPAEEPPAAPAASPAQDGGFEHTEETCPGHVASAADAKVCGRCGTHVDSLRLDDLDDDLPF